MVTINYTGFARSRKKEVVKNAQDRYSNLLLEWTAEMATLPESESVVFIALALNHP
jgi:hypothetical protein